MTVNIHKLSKDWEIDASRTDDGTPIRFALYQRTPQPKHLLVFLNGRSEWIEKYAFLPELMQLPADCAFLTMDHRGQGASGGPRGDIDTYTTYAKDVDHIIQEVGLNVPYSIVAHSMGGLIALFATLTKNLYPESLVIGSPLLGFKQKGVAAKLLKPVIKNIRYSPAGTLPSGFHSSNQTPFEENPYTHDADHYALLSNAPYRVPSPTFRWLGATLEAIEKVFDPIYLNQLEVPVLLLSGTKESVVDPKAFHKWVKEANHLSKGRISFRQTTGAKHELFNEISQLRKASLLSTQFWMKEIWGERHS